MMTMTPGATIYDEAVAYNGLTPDTGPELDAARQPGNLRGGRWVLDDEHYAWLMVVGALALLWLLGVVFKTHRL